MTKITHRFPNLVWAIKVAILNDWPVRDFTQWTQDYLQHGDRCSVQIGAFTDAIACRLGVSKACARRWLHAAEKAGLVLSNPCRGGCTRWWLVGFADYLLQHMKRPQRCRVCGCTNEQACPGGCYWIECDLCSACAGSELPF